MLEIIRLAGPVGIPLLLCSIVSVAICLERLLYYLLTSTNTNRLRQTIKWTLNHRGVSEAAAIAKRTRGPVAAVLYAGLTANSFSRESMEAAMEIAAQREIAKLEKRLRALDVIVTISPLLGLLGTVTGIIRTFNIMSQLQGLTTPQALSGGLAEALLSTAIGLIIAIPTLVMSHFFNGLVDRFVLDMNESATQLLEIMEHRRELREVSATK